MHVEAKVPCAQKLSLKSPYLLPDVGYLIDEEPFAEVAAAWNETSLLFCIEVRESIEKVSYPNFREGDSVELFVDTRNLKEVGMMTRFCHHFFFLPEAVEGIRSGEVTRLRADETRPLADASLLAVDCQANKRGYRMSITLYRDALTGYEPETRKKLGFTYRINRAAGEAQHFSSPDFKFETHPGLWATLILD